MNTPGFVERRIIGRRRRLWQQKLKQKQLPELERTNNNGMKTSFAARTHIHARKVEQKAVAETMECVQIVERRIRRRRQPPFISRTWSGSIRASVFMLVFVVGFFRGPILCFCIGKRQMYRQQAVGERAAVSQCSCYQERD